VREGDLRISLDQLEQQAVTYLARATAATPFLPASQIVQLSLVALEYERTVNEMESLEMDEAERVSAQQRLDRSEQVLQRLESVRTDSGVRVGFLPAPAEDVQTAEMARIQKTQMGEYMAILVFEAAFYQQVHGAVPNRRPVTLLYKIGQALIDYAHLKKDILLIAQSQPVEHQGLYDELITNSGIESVATLLSRSLTYLETMPVGNLPDAPISPTSHVGRHLATADRLERAADRIIAEHAAFPLMETPTQTIVDITTELATITHDRRNSATAWILLLPQHEIDALEDARERLERKRTTLTGLHIATPQELASLFFLRGIILSARYQQPGSQSGNEATALYLELHEVRLRLQQAVDRIVSQRLPFPANVMTLMQQALPTLEQYERDLAGRMEQFLNSSSSSSSTSSSSSSSSSTSSTSAESSHSVSSTRSLSSIPRSSRIRPSASLRSSAEKTPSSSSSSFSSSNFSSSSSSSAKRRPSPSKTFSSSSAPMVKRFSDGKEDMQSSLSSSLRPSKRMLKERPYTRQKIMPEERNVMKETASSLPSVSSASLSSKILSSSASSAVPTFKVFPVSSISSSSTAAPAEEKSVQSASASSPLALPAPRITSPTPSITGEIVVNAAKVDVYGLVDNRTIKLLFNGEPASSYTPTSGKFWITLNLVPGKNTFAIVSMDVQGMQSAATMLTIVYWIGK
ncbi:MAG: proteophosphoglycan ppg1, partial [Candidatus Peregrinibacteria bacterium Greene1014_49]